ncbi:hypothetical protein [uncultured Eubacterium sp.]|uniref:hypothetical protein n=1 Tax=uncultured Eubacterium sp. TaxID=165185 RepID=UPI0028037A4F|nr:hypothetical protein [uncultured Eubacterium sp.]
MKNKLKIAICVVMTCVFMLIPFSAFAYYDNPSPKLLVDIAKGSNKDMYSIGSSHSAILWEEKDYFYLVVTSIDRPFRCVSYGSALVIPRPSNLSNFDYQKYTYPKSNIYDVTNTTVTCVSVAYNDFKIGTPTKILYSNQNVYGGGSGEQVDTSKVFFQQMNSVPKTPGNRVPLNTQLSSIQLTGTLSELIAMLPILLPVLITLLAIRKGIGFTLTILRTA